MDPITGLSYVEHLSYIGFFLAIAFSGYIIPVPEELLLIFAGYLAAQGFLHFPIIILVSVAGAIVGDSLIYYLSGHGSRFTQKYHDRVERTHAGWYIRHVKNNPAKTIFFSRFIVGMRFLNPLVSGLLKVPRDIFILATALSASIYIPFVISLGYYFSNQIDKVVHIAESIRQGIIWGLVGLSVLLCVLFFKNLIEKARY